MTLTPETITQPNANPWGGEYSNAQSKVTSTEEGRFASPHGNLSSVPLERQDILNELQEIRQAIAELKTGLASVQATNSSPAEDVIQIRDISDDEARKDILSLFQDSEQHLYYSDIEEELCLDIEQVIRVCDALIGDGKITVDAID